MKKYKVCVSDGRHPRFDIEQEAIEKMGWEFVMCQCRTEDDVIKYCGDADAIFLDGAPITARVISHLKNCKVINRYGVGYENVDVEAATKAGIKVTYVPDYCMEDVSDMALALLMTCLRQVSLRDRKMKEGGWNIYATAFRLKGKTLGLLGFGRIARTLARKCSGFGLEKIIAFDPFVSDEVFKQAGVERGTLEEVLSCADFLSLHMPINGETRHILNDTTLRLMKPTAILVNTARGALIDSFALADALKEGRLLYAGLDVHEYEPMTEQCPYLHLDNAIVTDHSAYNTEEGVIELKTKAAQNVIDVLLGQPLTYPINKLN